MNTMTRWLLFQRFGVAPRPRVEPSNIDTEHGRVARIRNEMTKVMSQNGVNLARRCRPPSWPIGDCLRRLWLSQRQWRVAQLVRPEIEMEPNSTPAAQAKTCLSLCADCPARIVQYGAEGHLMEPTQTYPHAGLGDPPNPQHSPQAIDGVE